MGVVRMYRCGKWVLVLLFPTPLVLYSSLFDSSIPTLFNF